MLSVLPADELPVAHVQQVVAGTCSQPSVPPVDEPPVVREQQAPGERLAAGEPPVAHGPLAAGEPGSAPAFQFVVRPADEQQAAHEPPVAHETLAAGEPDSARERCFLWRTRRRCALLELCAPFPCEPRYSLASRHSYSLLPERLHEFRQPCKVLLPASPRPLHAR